MGVGGWGGWGGERWRGPGRAGGRGRDGGDEEKGNKTPSGLALNLTPIRHAIVEPSGFFFLLNVDRENIFLRTVRDGEPRTAASIFTHLLSSEGPDHTAIVGRVTSDYFRPRSCIAQYQKVDFLIFF